MLRTTEQNLISKRKKIIMVNNGISQTKGTPIKIVKGKTRKSLDPNLLLML